MTETQNASRIRLFVSHAAADGELVKRFIHCVEQCLVVEDSTLRCTSMPGRGLTVGDDDASTLRSDLMAAKAVVGVITPSALASKFVLMELGAAWVLEKRVLPIVHPPIEWDDLPKPYDTTMGCRTSDPDGVTALIEAIAKSSDYAWHESRARSTAAVNEFCKAAALDVEASANAAHDVRAIVDRTRERPGMDERARVLVADPEEFIRNILCDFYGMEGWRPVAVASGADLMNAVSQTAPAVVVTSVDFRDVAGVDLVRAVAKRAPTIVTANETKKLAACYEAGAFAVVQKPFKVEKMIELVRSALERNRIADRR